MVPTHPLPHPPPAARRYPGGLLVGVGVGAWAAGILPSLVPVMRPEATAVWADRIADAPALVVVLLVAVGRLAGAPTHAERAFWRLIAGSALGWSAVRGLYILVPYEEWSAGVGAASDLVYLASILSLAVALERPPGEPVAAGKRRESLGVLLLGLVLLAYSILIPVLAGRETYSSWLSSLLLYPVLDAFLLTRAVSLLRSGPAPEWRSPLAWLGATFALWLTGDLTQGLMQLELLPWVDPGTPLDLLWHAPSLTFLLAVSTGGGESG